MRNGLAGASPSRRASAFLGSADEGLRTVVDCVALRLVCVKGCRGHIVAVGLGEEFLALTAVLDAASEKEEVSRSKRHATNGIIPASQLGFRLGLVGEDFEEANIARCTRTFRLAQVRSTALR